MSLIRRRNLSPRLEHLDREAPRDTIIRQLTHHLEQVEQEAARIRPALDSYIETKSPFLKWIREAPIPRTFRLARPLDAYNRMVDLDAFIRKYKRAMELEEANKVPCENASKSG